MKYKYKCKTFKVKDVIELSENSIVISSKYDCACNHHKYEDINEDTIYICWLEPM